MKKRIMVVDDDPDILITFRTIFEHHGYNVLAVDSGRDCLEELNHGFQGIVLIDLMMPFMDGWDTISEIVKQGLDKNIIIKIITARGSIKTDKMKGLEPFIKDYITKPFDLEKIVTDIIQDY